MTTFAFADAEAVTEEITPDSIPPVSDINYPCEVCGKESGPYRGRGRKPTRCSDHKKQRSASSPKVTGTTANLAAQATATLEQVNGILAVAAMGLGMFETAGVIAEQNEPFKEKAYVALLTDPELCKLIVKGGVKSAKISLGIAYLGFLMPVGMTAYTEYRSKMEERRIRLEANDG